MDHFLCGGNSGGSGGGGSDVDGDGSGNSNGDGGGGDDSGGNGDDKGGGSGSGYGGGDNGDLIRAIAAPEMASASTRTRIKWQKLEETKQRKSMTRPCECATSSSSQEQGIGNVEEDNTKEDVCSSGCATPKAKRFRIPEVLTCPPAPKKRRVMPNCSSNRSPIAFFASPDIELFFFSALRNVSA
ncbi:hypothetical protein E2542_SST12461 [Spatholobus suberectus]|nr:hypothetical protein E2542_SST12461 [Spatholobus suberectus]